MAQSSPVTPGSGTLLSDGLIPDRFKVRQRLGRGAAGQVLLAWDSFFERDVALKVIDLDEPRALAASLHEARALARLRHPNVVSVYELVHRASPPLLVMEYVVGEELEQILHRAGQPLEPALVLAVGRAVAAALAAAHDAGMLHRDVKPQNVLLAEDGSIKLIDFGLAGAAVGNGAGPLVAPPAGTPAYCAPEVLEGAAPDERADLFSLGVILFRMLTLRHPFPSSSLAELREAVRQPPPDPRSLQPGISVWLADLVMHCLAPHSQRYGSARELLHDLDRAAEVGARSLPEAPYPGLRSFDFEEVGIFFGREEEVARLLGRLRETPVLLLAGLSGAGKSSLAAAGICPAVKRGALGDGLDWRVVRLTPGAKPINALALALAEKREQAGALAAELGSDPASAWRRLLGAPRRGAPDRGLLCVVDQLEEICTACDSADERARAGCALLAAVEARSSRLKLLLCARDDFLGRLGRVPGLGDCLAALHLVRPLDGESLRAAVLEPARAFGFAFEDEALVEDMLAELAGRSGTMPLLQFALQLLWAQRDAARRLLPASALRALGGLGAALARTAEQAHQDLVRQGLGEETRRLLLELCTTDGTRRRRSRAELRAVIGGDGRYADERLASVLERLRQVRLLVGSDEALELAHESLIREWERLRRWLDDERSLRQLAEDAEHDAQRWGARAKAAELLWRGRSLEESRALLAGAAPLSKMAVDFLHVSLTEARRARLRRVLVAGLAALLIVGASGFTLRALYREWRAARRQAAAEHAALRAEHQLRQAEAQRGLAQRDRAFALEEKRRVLEAWVRERRQLEEDLARTSDEGLREHIRRRLALGPPLPLASSRPTTALPELCLFAPSSDLSLGGPWRLRLRPLGERLRGAGYGIGCAYPYVRSSPRFRAAAQAGEIQHSGALPEKIVAALLAELRPLYPQIRARRVPARQLFRTIDVLIPEEH